MFDLNYRRGLKFIAVDSVTIEGDAEELARAVEEWDRESDPDEWDNVWPTFGGGDTGEPLLIPFDTDFLGVEGSITWRCTLDFSALDWGHPWEDRAIMAAEAVYHEHRDSADPRWTLPHIEADALRFLRQCVADTCGAMTPKDADKLTAMFLYNALPSVAEDADPDPMAELLAEAMQDAAPVSTGIARLDAALGGGIHRGISVIAGDPSSGKTALAAQLALYCANQQEGGVVYDMADMGGERSALARMVTCAAAVCGVDGCELGRFDQWDARELYEARAAYERIGMGRVSLTDTTDVADLLQGLDASTGRVTLVVIDFAQAMSYDGRPLAFDPEAASQAVRELRAWAHDHGAVVVLLSAYSKSAIEAHDRGAKPSMADVLGSAEIAYSSEHVLALTNPHDGTGSVRVRDLKSRYGGGSCTLHLDPDHVLLS